MPTPEAVRLLILEDAPEEAKLEELVLRRAGISFRGCTVSNRADFIEALELFRPEVVIMDYNLPDIDGMTAIREIRQRDAEVPILLVTGALGDEAAVEVVKAGATDYVRKDRLARLPIVFTSALAAAVAQRERRDALQALQQSARDVEDLYNNAPCGYHSISGDLTILAINDTELRWLGYDRDEVVGKMRIAGLLTPDSVTKLVQAACPNQLLTGEIRDVEIELVRKDGTKLPVLWSSTSVVDADGRFVRSRTTTYDISRIKAAEQRERMTADDLQNVLYSSDVAMLFLDRKLSIRFFTPAAAAFYSLTLSDLGRPLASLTSIVDYDDIVIEAETVLQILAPIERESQTRDRIRYIRRILPYRTRDADVDGIVIVLFDITERKNAERALQDSKARLALAVTTAQLGVWEWDLRVALVRFDERAAEISGGLFPADQWVPAVGPDRDPWHDAIHPEDRAAREVAITALVEGRIELGEFEYRLRRPTDGAWIWVVHRAIIAARDPSSGQPTRILGVVREITAQREADLERQQLLCTIDLAPFLARHMDGTIRFWSKGCEALYGFAAGQALGCRMHDLLRTDPTSPLADIEPALLQHGEWRGDLVQRRRDGTEITVAAREALLRDAAGRPVSVVTSVADVTALRQAQAELHRVNLELEARVREEVEARTVTQGRLAQAQKVQALGQLAGGIAHDFNNILQSVAGAAALIERRCGDTAGVRRLSRLVMEAAERGSSITRRLLAFGRRGDLRAEAVDPIELLGGMREVLAHTLGAAVEVHVRLGPGLPPLMADKGQLETALVNLATNARDAMPQGGTLTLSAAAETVPAASAAHPVGLAAGRYVRLAVADTGMGMDARTLARASEPFFTTKQQGMGTGLGLPMAKGFAEQSGGALSIETRPGNGTTVTLWLPQAKAAGAVTQASDAPALGLGDATVAAARVLLVDDDALLREVMAEYLEEAGYAVLTAGNGIEALALLTAGETIDLLVTDLSMPGINGLAVISEAQALRPDLPAVLLTGYAGDGATLALGGAISGSFSVLRKPVTGTLLLDRIAALLAAGAAQIQGAPGGTK